MIAVPTAEFARRADFYDYFQLMDKPEGTIITFVHGQSPARNRNMAIEQAILNNCTHILFLDDDLAFKPDLLTKLLSHDKDIVSGYYLMRNYPHQPILFDFTDSEGKCRHYYPPDSESGLVEATAFGLGCVLIKIEVFKSLEAPWIRLGELEKDHWCDDIGFFNRVREKGWKLYCDLSLCVGHMASVTIWPEYKDDKWLTKYNTNSPHGEVAFPALRPAVESEEVAV